MTELMRQVQTALLAAATTVDVWRDGAILLLALVVIGCLRFVGEAGR